MTLPPSRLEIKYPFKNEIIGYFKKLGNFICLAKEVFLATLGLLSLEEDLNVLL